MKNSLSDLRFSMCLLHVLYILSLSSPPLSPLLSLLPSSLLSLICGRKWLSYLSWHVSLTLHIIVPDTQETNSPSLLPGFRFPIERILLTQFGTHHSDQEDWF